MKMTALMNIVVYSHYSNVQSRPDEYYGRLGQWVSWDHFLLGSKKKSSSININNDSSCLHQQTTTKAMDFDVDNEFR